MPTVLLSTCEGGVPDLAIERLTCFETTPSIQAYSLFSSYLPLFLFLIAFLLFQCASVWENTRALGSTFPISIMVPSFIAKPDDPCIGRRFAYQKLTIIIGSGNVVTCCSIYNDHNDSFELFGCTCLTLVIVESGQLGKLGKKIPEFYVIAYDGTSLLWPDVEMILWQSCLLENVSVDFSRV